MRSFSTFILFVVPSATSFTLPAASRTQHDVCISSRIFAGPTNFQEADTKDETTANYDPSDAFNNGHLLDINMEADLMIGLLENPDHNVDDTTSNDIVRDLDGRPLSAQYFCEKMGFPVTSFRQANPFSDRNSNGCRVHLEPSGQTAFYKHNVFDQLDHAHLKMKSAPHKLSRDAKSYQVVASFLQSKACAQMTARTGVHIPKCYDACLQPNFENPIDSKFSFLFQDLSPAQGWYQQWLLEDKEACQAALSMFAKMHAFFWNGSDFYKEDQEAASELQAGVWPSASYVQPKFQNWDQYRKVAQEWDTKKLKFETELGGFDYYDNLGDRLESVAQECGYKAHPFALQNEVSQQYNKYRTFTHGDPKQANLFFRRRASTAQRQQHEQHELQVGLIDFQWSGFGLAATDIAHFLTSAVHADQLVNSGEEELMRYYFDELQTHLVEFGAYKNADDARQQFSYDSFSDQYETGVLDICRLMIAYTWSRFDEPVTSDDKEACARTMNKTSYNKSIPNIVWLMTRCDEIMKSRGV